MNKTAIKNFAVWARNKLIADISYKAELLGITEREIKAPLPQSADDAQFFDIGSREPYQITGAAISQRRALAEKINEQAKQNGHAAAYKAVMEEAAYTWFNRLIAVRFMEVNDYLPSRVRVLSGTSGKQEPDIVTTPFDTDLPFSQAEREYMIACQTGNKLDELFRMLFIKQCNALSDILPELFERIGEYTELLLNISFTDKDGVVWHLINDVSEADFTQMVEIIGWMYQYYNTEPKQEVFDGLKKNIKISKERIPAATQLFTPDWIVRYMVENSLGRLWLEGHPGDTLKANWKYYLDEADQTPEVKAQLELIRSERRGLSPEDITFIDPCMGSGHILVYAFEVFMQIYESAGYTRQDAAKLILEKNIHGLDIDKRAYQLAYFALMMKARQYNRRIFGTDVKPQVYYPAGFADGQEHGSLLKIDDPGEMPKEPAGQFTLFDEDHAAALHVWHFKRLLAGKYDVVVTNPPYMGASGMSGRLAEFVKREYADSKSDLFAAFMQQCAAFAKPNGYQAMITQHAWMFLSSYEKLRSKIMLRDIVNMAHLGARAFAEIGGEVVQATAFVMRSGHIGGYSGGYVRLVDINDADEKEAAFLSGNHRYTADSANFAKIPGSPVAYWVKAKYFEAYDKGIMLSSIGRVSEGIKTGNNDRFLKFWHETDQSKFKIKWFPHHKGGEYRRWFGNLEHFINWENDGYEIKNAGNSGLQGSDMYFKPVICWSKITSKGVSFRTIPADCLFDSGSPAFHSEKMLTYILGLLNSCIVNAILSITNPTLNTQVGDIKGIPYIFGREKDVCQKVTDNISLSRADWDSFETSWDFKRHPLIGGERTVAAAFTKWKRACGERFNILKANEEELNRLFIDIYGLQNELIPEVQDKDVTVRRFFDSKDDIPDNMRASSYALTKSDAIKSLISYAVGCIFGRYSLDAEGLVYAGGKWDAEKYKSFAPDTDNIVPITDEEYLSDDIVTRLAEFIRIVYGADAQEENLRFIASALGGKGNSAREVIRGYFLKDFFQDHVKRYQKRPIYWLFDSGKANGFKALVYLHRCNQDTVGKLRIDYLHRLQRVYESEMARMRETAEKSTEAREISTAQKRLEKLTKQLKETREYDEKIAYLALARTALDLDDGVKANYEKLQTGTDGKKYEVLGKL